MNKIENVKNEVENILYLLISHNISINQNYPIIREVGRTKKLEWSNIKNLSISMKNLDYAEIYEEIDKNQDYTLKLIDGNLIQIMYEFEGNELIAHRLAMFPSPKVLSFDNDQESFERDEIYSDIVMRNTVPFPIRFDYSKDDVESEYEHPNSHATFGQYKNCRIPVYGPLSPIEFVSFVLENFYYSIYNDVLKDVFPKKRCEKIYSIKEFEKKKMHFNVI